MDLAARLESLVGSANVLTDPAARVAYGRDWLSDYNPDPCCVVRPRTAAEVSAIVRLASEHGVPIVPSGGRTGLSGGAAATCGEIALSLERMNTIEPVNRIDRTVRCEAGAITERIQRVAEEAGLLFPVDFASRGSSQIGGNIATNAGGIRVIRFGNMRDWVLGLTVVTGTGEILELNGDLFKNNTGYDLRGLVCGSEGTLAIITAATLKLTDPLPPSIRVLCGVERSGGIGELLVAVRSRYPTVGLFEYFSGVCLELVVRHNGARAPFSTAYPGYVLFEIAGDSGAPNEELIEWLGELAAAGLISDAIIGRSVDQGQELLALRESISGTLSKHYTIHKNDIAVPVHRMGSFLGEIEGFISRAYPDARCALFGHVADGNIHVNIIKPDGVSTGDFLARARATDADFFALVRAARGTISAEHGVGLLKRDFLHFTRSQVEIELLRGIKRVFDPHGILNPGKIFTAIEAGTSVGEG